MENSTGPVKKKCVLFVFAYKQIDFESCIVPRDRALAHPALPLQMPILGPLLHYGNATYSIIAMQEGNNFDLLKMRKNLKLIFGS